MARAKIVNKFGTLIGWNQITVNILGRELEGITEVEYEDSFDIKGAKGAGYYDVGTEEGNYEAKISMSLYLEELIALTKQLPKGVRIQQITFDVVLQYEYNGQLYKDIARNCRIKVNPRSLKQGEGKSVNKIDMHTSQIDWNV